MIHLMLDYLRIKPLENLLFPLESLVEIFHLNDLKASDRPLARQGQTALLRLVGFL